MIIDEEEYLMHYGVLRKSGRYPWGSGSTQNVRNKAFLDYVEGLRREGMSDVDIARGAGITTTELRAAKSIAKNAQKAGDIAWANRLKDKGMSNVAIGQKMGLNESSVRALLVPGLKDRTDILQTTASMLKDQVDKKTYVDIGSGVEKQLGISETKLRTAVAVLKEQGYEVHTVQVDQLGTNTKTLVKVLAPKGTTYRDVATNKGMIQQITDFSDDGGRSYSQIQPPLSVNSKRIAIRYKEEGGAKADGVIYVRPGVEDISLGSSRYAQVRVQVDGSHYLKGMAMYKDDLPPGVDLEFNTNKSNTGNKLDAMKAIKDDPENPFGSIVRQRLDPRTGRPTSAMNVVGSKDGSGEEGGWDAWSKSLSSQFLSKQSPALAKSQLDVTFEAKKQDLDEIMRLTNPVVRRKLLESYADGTDSAAVHLKAAAIPRQRTQVILPINSMKETEVYAPNFRDGEKVVLVRYPHGGIFEIPELTVNNRNSAAKKALGSAQDAIGINHKVAARLSGADFDGDTVLVIPNNNRKIKTAPALEGLKGFDPQATYPKYDGMKVMDKRTKGREMGVVSNLITDMTIRGANVNELARAVRHSMVVIDAEKHQLNYRQSAVDNGISQLKAKYQSSSRGGASTIISRKKSPLTVAEFKPRSAANGGPVDKATGKKVYEPTNNQWVDQATGKTIVMTTKVNRLAYTDDAHTLSSGTPIEKIYADHSNRLKRLADQARLTAVNTQNPPLSSSAKRVYSSEVASLNAKLDLAYRNKPRERQAQILGNAEVQMKRQSNPDMGRDELKKVKALALSKSRLRAGAQKPTIDITPQEWDAIQAGAVSANKLKDILDNADLEQVKQLATPKTPTSMTTVRTNRAKLMINAGYTQAEIADALGVSLSTLKTSLSE